MTAPARLAALLVALNILAPARAEPWDVADLWALDPAAVPVVPASRPDLVVTHIEDRPDGRRCLVWWDETWRREYRGCLEPRAGVTVEVPRPAPRPARPHGGRTAYVGA